MLHSAALEQLGISASALTRRGLSTFPEAEELEVAEVGDNGREYLLIPEAAAAWRGLKAAAMEDGISVSIVSAFRSIERQLEIIRGKLSHGHKLEEVLTVLAPPGYSEHHTGRAVDLGTEGAQPLDLAFAETPAFHWLTRRAQEFQFHLSYPRGNPNGYQFEPWHWCYSAI